MNTPTIVLTVDEPYACGAAVTLASLVQSNPAMRFDVRLLHDNLTSSTLDYFMEVAEALDIGPRLECTDVSPELPKGLSSQRHYSRSAYARYLAPLILPNHSRLFYLDSDMICQIRLDNLFALDSVRSGRAFAATNLGSADQSFRHIPRQLQQSQGISDITPIFCTGGMLIGAPAWNFANMTPKLLDFAVKHHGELAAIDQDAMNLLFPEGNLILDSRFNITTPLSPEKVSLTPLRRGIFHVCDGLKPWQVLPTRNPFRVDGLWHLLAASLPLPPNLREQKPFFAVPTTSSMQWLKFLKWSFDNHSIELTYVLHLMSGMATSWTRRGLSLKR